MSRLMGRLGRKSVASTMEPTHESAPLSQQPLEPTPTDPPDEEVVVRNAAQPAEMKPRALPAERSVDFSAMRELANLNARAAIDAHVRRLAGQRGTGKLAGAVAAISAAGVLLWLHSLGNAMAFQYAMVCLAVSAIWVFRYAVGLRRSPRSENVAKRIENSLVPQEQTVAADRDGA